MFKKSISVLKILSINLSILFLSLIACYVLVMRIALHFLPEYKAEIVQYLSTSSNHRIEISSFSSHWDGFDPVLQVNDLTVESIDHLHINRVSFYFSFIQSVLALQPKFDRILIEKTELSVKQTSTGDWEFLNYNSNNFTDEQNSALPPLTDSFLTIMSSFNGTTINIKDFNAVINNEKGKIRSLRLPTLNVNYSNDQLFASGKILQKHSEKALLNFSLKGRGLLSNEPINGVLYVEARSSEFFGELLGVYDWQKISIQDIEGSARAWINFKGADITSIYGDFQVSELNWKADEKLLPPIHNLAFSYLWQKDITNKSLIVDNFAFQWSAHKCEAIDLIFTFNSQDINILADKVNVACFNNIAISMDILPEKWQSRLSVSEPSGFLNNVNLTIFSPPPAINPLDALNVIAINKPSVNSSLNSVNDKASSSFILEAMLEDIHIKAYENSPSAKNLDAYLYADDSSGYVSLLTDNFELGFPKLFLEPWEIIRAEGLVSWSLSDSDTTINSDGLRLWREDSSLIYGDFILRLNDDSHEDYLFLALGLQDVLFQDAVKFVPYYSVSNDLYSWLSSSLIAGSVNNGVYYGYGSVESESPPNSYTSSVFLQSKNGVVQFEPDWPYLEELEADVMIQNGQVEINAKHANIAGTPLENLKAILPEVDKGKTKFLSVSADALLTSTLVDYWLLESPIADKTKDIMQQLTINTSANANIHLNIPVSKAENTEHIEGIEYLINVKVVDGNILHIPSKLTFEGVNGMVSVDSVKGVNAQQIKSTLFNEQTLLNIKTNFHANQSEPPTQLTKLTLQGKLGVASIFEYFESTKPLSLQGDFQYLAELSLSNDEKKYPLLSIQSDLFGVSCLCPSPFSKNADQKEDLTLSLLLKPDQSYFTGILKSKHMPGMKAELMFTEDKLSFGELLFGGAKVTNTDIKGLNIAADLKLANLQSWIDFLEETLKEQSADKVSSNTNSYLKQVQLNIDDLDGFGYLFHKNQILIKPQQDDWIINIKGKDLSGQVYLPNTEDGIDLNFEKLNLVSLDKILDKPDIQNLDNSKKIDPRTFPKLTFNAKNLYLENRSVGTWKFNLEPDEQGSIFKNIKGRIKNSNISGQMNWRFSKDLENTIATFDIVGDDIAPVFEAFQMPVLMTSNKYSSDFAIHWPGSPMDFTLGQLSGNLSLSLEDGFLKTEDQKTGVLRLFGVLNTESIKRRLKLDFSDLYKSGVGFDTFSTKASIDQGLLTLTEPLVIDGPAGKYVLNGRSDLSSKQLDIDMLVELPFSQNVPLAALVLGAPQIGGLVWVADKLLGEPLSALTTSRYDISGNWDEPRVNLRQALNASKKDRSKERGTRDVGK